MRMLKVGLIALLLALQFKLWFGDTGIYEQKQTQNQIQKLLASNEKLAEENRQIGSEIDNLKQKHEAIEAKARTELGMIREGERFFHFKNIPSSNQPSAS